MKSETLFSALIELEYLVHQIDNGYDFEQLNGFEIVNDADAALERQQKPNFKKVS